MFPVKTPWRFCWVALPWPKPDVFPSASPTGGPEPHGDHPVQESSAESFNSKFGWEFGRFNEWRSQHAFKWIPNSNSIPVDLLSAHTPHWVATTGHHEPGARFRPSGSLMLWNLTNWGPTNLRIPGTCTEFEVIWDLSIPAELWLHWGQRDIQETAWWTPSVQIHGIPIK